MRLHPEVVVSDTDDGAILLHLGTGRYWQLNPTGSLVLDRVLAGGSVESVTDDVAQRFGVSRDRVRGDVSSIIDGLAGAKLVVPA